LGTGGFPRSRISKKIFLLVVLPATVGAVDLFLLFAAEERNLLRVTQLQMVHQVLPMFKGFAALFTGLLHHRPTYHTTIETIHLRT
jgi:hypothetical protein